MNNLSAPRDVITVLARFLSSFLLQSPIKIRMSRNTRASRVLGVIPLRFCAGLAKAQRKLSPVSADKDPHKKGMFTRACFMKISIFESAIKDARSENED
jgi:hypothetical protein